MRPATAVFAPHVTAALSEAAIEHGCDPDAFAAAAWVVSGGAVAASDAQDACPVRYEFHVFHRRLSPSLRRRAIAQGLASPRAGLIPAPTALREHYALLDRAKLIDRDAAFSACAWGFGAVLGERAPMLGYASAEALADEACSGLAGQARVMLRLVRRHGLTDALNARDWRAFAEGYRAPERARFAGIEGFSRACERLLCSGEVGVSVSAA
jgi:hypothetical protein